MNGIHCFSTAPFFMGRDVNGHETINKEFHFPDYLLLTLCLSALQWRETNGQIVLHTDSIFYNFLKERNLLDIWDDVLCSLDDLSEKYKVIDHAVFWSASKFYCYSLEKSPFACVDTDIIVWEKLRFQSESALIFSHWEIVEKQEICYGKIDMLEVDKSFQFFENDFSSDKGLNMSITLFNNEDFKNEFLYEAERYMKNCLKRFDKRYATPELLYMEQVLPVSIAKKNAHKIEPLIDCVWSPKDFRFLQHDPIRGEWIFNEFNDNQIFTHLWFHKHYLATNLDERRKYVDKLKYLLKTKFPSQFDNIESNKTCS